MHSKYTKKLSNKTSSTELDKIAMNLATNNIRQNSESNLMDASLDLGNLVQTMLEEDRNSERLYLEKYANKNCLVKTSRRDKYGRYIFKAPKTQRVKINIKDVEELRNQIKHVLIGEREDSQISKLIAKNACKHQVSFADNNPEDGVNG